MRSTRGYDDDDDRTQAQSEVSHDTRRTAADRDDNYSEATTRNSRLREGQRRRRRRSPSNYSDYSDSDTERRSSYARPPPRDRHEEKERDGKHDGVAYAILALGVFSMLAGILRLRRERRGDSAQDVRRQAQARKLRQEDFERRKRERRLREDKEAERRYRSRDYDDQESVSELKTITYVPTEAPRSPSRGPRRLEPAPDDYDDRSRAPSRAQSRAGRSEAGSIGTQRIGHDERHDTRSRADSAVRSKRRSGRSRSDGYDSSNVGYPKK